MRTNLSANILYLMAAESTEKHGNISSKAFIYSVFFRGFRGHNIYFYQIEAVLITLVNT